MLATKLTGLTAAGSALILAALTASANEGDKPKSAKGTSQASQPQRIQVVSAKSLIGEDIRTREGDVLGEIEYLLISTADGSMRYAVVEAEGRHERDESAGNLIAIPWKMLGKNVGQEEIQLTVSHQQALTAPRLTEQRLNELLEPAMVTRVEEFWIPYADTTGEKKAGRGSQPSASKKRQEGQQAQRPQRTGDLDVLVTQTAVTTLVPPGMAKVDRLEDAEVVGSDGREIGEIETIAIDVNRGRAAYVLLGRGGFLGLGEEVVPVPFEVFQFSTQEPHRLTVSAGRVKQMQAFQGGEMPRRVQRQDLERLYQRFDVTPYWKAERAEERDERAG